MHEDQARFTPLERTDSPNGCAARPTWPALTALTTILVLATACGPAGTSTPTLTEIGVVELDLAVSGPGGYPSVTGPVLEDGVDYVYEAQGTFSIWGAGMWSSGSCQGTSEADPLFPSPNETNGTVGVDPEFWFAIPNGSALCDPDFEIPNHTGGIQVNFDGGTDFDHLEPVGGEPTEPSSDHTYSYELTGQGHALRIQREDGNTGDDYGVIRFTVYRVD